MERSMKYDFVGSINELEIRKCQRWCTCKVCDDQMLNEDIVYLRSARLHGQPFHICLDCWDKINLLVEDYKKRNADKQILKCNWCS